MSATLCPVTRTIPPDYMSVDEAVKATGISRRWLFKLIGRGRLQSYKLVGIRQTLLKRAEVATLDEPKPRSRDDQ
jgi:excisionase family DNA binding protein